MLLVRAVGEGLGGPYSSGATDVGAGIIYTLLFLTLLLTAPHAGEEPLIVDRVLVAHHPRWGAIADFGRIGA